MRSLVSLFANPAGRAILVLASVVSLASPRDGVAAGAGAYSRLTLDQRRDMQREARVLIGLLEGYHYRSKPLVEINVPLLLDYHFWQLDPRMVYLDARDEKFVQRRFGRNLKSSYLLSGDLYPAFEIFDLFLERLRARHAWVSDRLGRPMVLDGDRTFEMDRSKSGRPADGAAADGVWEDLLTAELIDEVLGGADLEAGLAQLRRRYGQAVNRVAAVTADEIRETFLNGMLNLQDPHSGYDSWDTLLDREIELGGSVVGIGVELKIAGGAVVVDSLVPGGAAELSGRIGAGDRILSIVEDEAEIDLAGMTLPEVVRKLRGKPGTGIMVVVARPGDDQRRIVRLERARVQVTGERAAAGLFEVPCGERMVRVGAIRLPTFYGASPEDGDAPAAGRDVAELLGKLAGAGAEAVVLDLRDNPGGFVPEAVAVAGLFIDRGPMLVMRDASGRVDLRSDDKPGAEWSGPVVVLTSGRSASASEIVSGALQAYGRAVVVGDGPTFGKGTAQAIIPLREVDRLLAPGEGGRWGALRLTGTKFYLPDGNSTQVEGVASDVVVPAFVPPYFQREGEMFGALPWNRIDRKSFEQEKPGAVAGMSLATAETIAALAAASTRRADALPEFTLLRRRIGMLVERTRETAVSLNLATRREQRAKLEQERRELVREWRELGSQVAYDVSLLEPDAVRAQEAAHLAHLEQETGKSASQLAGTYARGVYFHPLPDGRLREVRFRQVDFASWRDEAADLAAAFEHSTGIAIDAGAIEKAMAGDDDAQSGDGFERALAGIVGEASASDVVGPGIASMLARIVALDPTVIGQPRPLDVHLREGLRIAAEFAVGVDPGDP